MKHGMHRSQKLLLTLNYLIILENVLILSATFIYVIHGPFLVPISMEADKDQVILSLYKIRQNSHAKVFLKL